ncbi:MAG: YitT family protein, partial [Planococcaceae bacterium]|nr:YitT family protein [Planococcaceae bacterium]
MKVIYWRWLFFIAGLIILAFGISLTIKGQLLGIGPWDVLHVGLYLNVGLTIGSWSIISGLVIVIGTAIGTKRLPKIGTWLNMILIGLFIDFFNWLLPDLASYFGQTIFFVAGVLIMGLGVGIYVAPNMGAGPR